jgi:hypothetical protein
MKATAARAQTSVTPAEARAIAKEAQKRRSNAVMSEVDVIGTGVCGGEAVWA